MYWNERRWANYARDLGSFLEPMLKSLGRSERRVAATRYVEGLLMPGQRKSIEPLAARLGVDAQSLQQFVRDSPWSAEAVWKSVRREVIPAFGPLSAWMVGETGWLKKGKHSVGVVHQYCGALGKKANCQVCVEVAVSDGELALLVAGQLYLKSWNKESICDRPADVPKEALYPTKSEIAHELLLKLLADDVAVAPVLADNIYGRCYTFRNRLRELQLEYCLQVTGSWLKAGTEMTDRPRTLRKLVREFAPGDWINASWKTADGSVAYTRLAWRRIWLCPRMHSVRHPEEAWLLVDWPAGEIKPYKCFLLHLHDQPTKDVCIGLSRGHVHIEQYFQRGKKDLGLDDYEGRSWRGFEHHLVLSALAYLFIAVCHQRATKDSAPDMMRKGVARDPAVAGEIKRLLHVLRNER